MSNKSLTPLPVILKPRARHKLGSCKVATGAGLKNLCIRPCVQLSFSAWERNLMGTRRGELAQGVTHKARS
jgi:hypothetical protein